MNLLNLKPKEIIVDKVCSREPDIVKDDILLKSIMAGGIQIPLVVARDDSGLFHLVDGYRRLKVASELPLETVPCVLADGAEKQSFSSFSEYLNFVRLSIDIHRQDLLPSQRAKLIFELKKKLKLSNVKVAQFLGVSPNTILNWILPEKCIPELQEKMDRDPDLYPEFLARVFKPLTQKGQETVLKEDLPWILQQGARNAHKQLREKYPPTEYQWMYLSPSKVERSLKRLRAFRTPKARIAMLKGEVGRLEKNLRVQETVLRDARMELEKKKQDIYMASPLIRKILEDERLAGLIPGNVRAEWVKFCERF